MQPENLFPLNLTISKSEPLKKNFKVTGVFIRHISLYEDYLIYFILI